MLTNNTNPLAIDPNDSTGFSPRAKFLSKSTKYKDLVLQLLADRSNFDKWKRDLNHIIFLTLDLKNFSDNPENYPKLSKQASKSLLFLISVTVHDELSSIVDRKGTASEDFEAIQLNFPGSICFQKIDLLDRLVDLQSLPAPTDIPSLQNLFNKIFDIFSNLTKVGASFSPLFESLFLQILVPPPFM